MTAFDFLRPPTPADLTAVLYKDWFHLNIFDLEAGRVGLINTSLHGPPDDHRARAVGVGLLAELGKTWLGGIEISSMQAAGIDYQGIALETVSLQVAPTENSLHASVRREADGLSLDAVATPLCHPLRYELPTPFGQGWIAWTALPLMQLSGSLAIDGKCHALDNSIGYHDHNWGRWSWGDDSAWEWGAFMLDQPRMALVFARTCDKAHRHYGLSHLTLIDLDQRRTQQFLPHAIRINFSGVVDNIDRRLPGALAAIYPDRRHPALPRQIEIQASSGTDRLQVSFNADTCAQLILAEPTRPGTAFINEMVGRCQLDARLNGKLMQATGLGVFEYVE